MPDGHNDVLQERPATHEKLEKGIRPSFGRALESYNPSGKEFLNDLKWTFGVSAFVFFAGFSFGWVARG